MRKTVIFISIILTLLSCKKNRKSKERKIEIYLTKNRIQSSQGIEINESNIDSLGYRELENRFDFSIIRLDTTNNKLIFAGEFKSKKNDLRNKPFLETNRIIEFNPKNGNLKIDSIGAKRITQLERSNNKGHQFVLTVNGKPKLFGYFYSYPFSFYCHTYTYDFLRSIKKTEFELTYGIDMRKVDLKKENYDLYSILYNLDNK